MGIWQQDPRLIRREPLLSDRTIVHKQANFSFSFQEFKKHLLNDLVRWAFPGYIGILPPTTSA